MMRRDQLGWAWVSAYLIEYEVVHWLEHDTSVVNPDLLGEVQIEFLVGFLSLHLVNLVGFLVRRLLGIVAG